MSVATTLKLPEALKSRITRLAKQSNKSAHSLMIEALEREVTREERMQSFVREALAADAEIEAGAAVYRAVYRAEDVHAWFDRLAHKRKTAPPKPWRK
jgi:predicted transcriptional regulator